ncbi:MAG TPA: hypothetical protein VN843_27095, partial [Anaerolineales bacterium]|nr:hypothetical protein [Anaerolineales bacterium]
ATESQRANIESARANKEALNAKSQEEAALESKRNAEVEAEKAKASAIVAQEQQKIATEKAEEARQQAEIAQEATRTARSQELSAQARAISPSNPGAGLLTALEAVRVKPIEEAQDALRATLVRFPEQEVLRGAQEEIRSAEFSADDRYAITTSFDGKARLYEVRTGALINTFEDRHAPILCAAFSPNGKYIVVSGMSMMMMGTRIGNDSDDSGHNPFLEVISLETRKTLHRLTDGTGTTISFSADSRYVLLSAGTIKKANTTMWVGSLSVMVELDTGKSIDLPKETVVGPAVFTPDNRILGVGTPPGLREPIIQIVDPSSRSVSSVSKVEGEHINDFGIFAQPTKQQKVVVVVDDHNLLLVDSSAGTVVARIPKPGDSVEFSPAGDLIAVGAGDGTIHLFRAPS